MKPNEIRPAGRHDVISAIAANVPQQILVDGKVFWPRACCSCNCALLHRNCFGGKWRLVLPMPNAASKLCGLFATDICWAVFAIAVCCVGIWLVSCLGWTGMLTVQSINRSQYMQPNLSMHSCLHIAIAELYVLDQDVANLCSLYISAHAARVVIYPGREVGLHWSMLFEQQRHPNSCLTRMPCQRTAPTALWNGCFETSTQY